MSFANTRQNKPQPKKDKTKDKTKPKATGKPKQPVTSHQSPVTPDELLRVPHSAITVEEGFNVRTDFGDDLTSIAEKGIISPVFGYRGGIGAVRENRSTLFLVEGERRIRYLGQLIADGKLTPDDPRAQVPFIVRQSLANRLERTVAMLDFGTTGKPLTFSERAEGCVRLKALGLDNRAIAERVHTTPTAVADSLDYCEQVAPGIRQAVDAGRLSGTTALDLARQVPDMAQQTELFREAQEKAGGAGEHVTAKHFSIPLGKEAKKKRAGVSIPSKESTQSIQCRVCSTDKMDGMDWPESDLCPKCQASPVAGVTEDDTTSADGTIWKHSTFVVLMPEESKAKVTLLVAFRDGRHRYGYEVKWPATFRPGLPANKQDGWKKEPPNVHGPAADTEDRARLYAAQAARCELEVKDFTKGDKPAALAALTEFIDALAKELGGEVHQPTTQPATTQPATGDQPPVTSHQSPVTAPVTAPPPDFAQLFATIEAFKKFYLNAKGIPDSPKFDEGMARLSTFMETARREREQSGTLRAERDAALMERDKAQGAWQSITARIANVEADRDRLEKELEDALGDNSLYKGVTEERDRLKTALAAKPADPSELRSTIALIESVIANVPGEHDREPHRTETLRIVADLLAGRLGTPQQERQILTGWCCGTLQTYEEASQQ